jgi:hypothetical protein
VGIFKNDSPPPPPDLTPLANASEEASQMQYKLGQDQLAWAKDQYNGMKPTTDKVVNSLTTAQDQQTAQSKELYDRYKSIYEPAQDEYLSDANKYDTAQRRDQNVGAAQAAVGQNFDAARDSATRQLESFGVDPSSTRYAALDIGTRTQEAAAKAGAGTKAALDTEATGLALRANAINMGNGLPGQSQGAQQTADSAGTGAVGAGNSSFSTGASAMGSPTSYFSGGTSALNGAGNMLNAGYQNTLGRFKADNEASSGFGTLLGTAIGVGAKIKGFAEGGAIPMDASPSHGAVTDDVPAAVGGSPIRLNGGEFVLPRDVVAWEGEKSLQNLIQKARAAKEAATAKPAVGAHPAAVSAARRQAIPMGVAA